MARVKKKIEMFKIILTKNENSKLKFEDILLSKTTRDYKAFVNGKDVSVTILSEDKDIIVGIMETLRKDNIPPKKHKDDKKATPLGLKKGEGLVYANVFLYEKERNILMYEVNKFGSFVYHFLKCLEYCCSEDKNWTEPFSLTMNTILNPNEYLRLTKMNYYKSIEVKFANPTEILKDYGHKNDAIYKILDVNKQLNSETFTAKFEVKSKRSGGDGLSDLTVRDVTTKIEEILNLEIGRNVKKMIVYGYSIDDEDDTIEKLEPIDLLADRYIKHIHLNEPKENIDLLEDQRDNQIRKLYEKCLPDFETMFSFNHG